MATLEKSELDIALERLTPEWLAGFFDGEGCLTIVRRRGLPALALHVTQCDQQILTLIGLKYGAGCQPYVKPRKSAKHRTAWCLQFCGAAALPFLETIAPHVILKRKLVEWGIEMAKLHRNRGSMEDRPKRVGSGPRMMDPKIRERREELMNLVRKENQSGKLPIQ